MFANQGAWVSIGFTPKAKDPAVMMSDLLAMDYLKGTIEGVTKTSIVTDGKKVRMGFQGEFLEPFRDQYADLGEQLKSLAVEILVGQNKKPQEAIFELTLSLQERLHKILASRRPMAYELFRGLNLAATMMFHQKQCEKLLETKDIVCGNIMDKIKE